MENRSIETSVTSHMRGPAPSSHPTPPSAHSGTTAIGIHRTLEVVNRREPGIRVELLLHRRVRDPLRWNPHAHRHLRHECHLRSHHFLESTNTIHAVHVLLGLLHIPSTTAIVHGCGSDSVDLRLHGIVRVLLTMVSAMWVLLLLREPRCRTPDSF